jgi:hypothetical protein
LTALARRRPVGTPISGDTIVTIPRQSHPIGLCVEDPDARRLRTAPHADLFKVRLANTEARRESASYLIQRRYAWRGYATGENTREAPSRITIAAHDPDGIVGTVTVGLDTEDGLFIDGLYGEEINRLRTEGRRVAEFTKLAVDNNSHSKPLLAALFHIAYICARRIHRCTDLLIEVNPRHCAFYQRMLGFELFGELRGDPRVGAPAVLLRMCLERGQREIARLGGKIELASTTRSLYPYFFAPREELMIERRLRAIG